MSVNNEANASSLGSRRLAALGLVAAVFGAASLGSLQYSGLINQMGEWQFKRFGFYLPAFSVFVWVALAALVIAAAAALLARRSQTAEFSSQSAQPTAAVLRNIMLILGFLAGLVALGGAINLLFLPSSKGLERLVTPSGLAPGVEGNARLQGFRVSGPMVRYSEGVLFWKQDIFLVPLVASGAGEAGKIRVFSQVTKYEAASKIPTIQRGVLRSGALARELYPLYAAQGVAVEDNAAVLYRNSFAMALPTLLLIGEAAVVALVALVVALILHRRRALGPSS